MIRMVGFFIIGMISLIGVWNMLETYPAWVFFLVIMGITFLIIFLLSILFPRKVTLKIKTNKKYVFYFKIY